MHAEISQNKKLVDQPHWNFLMCPGPGDYTWYMVLVCIHCSRLQHSSVHGQNPVPAVAMRADPTPRLRLACVNGNSTFIQWVSRTTLLISPSSSIELAVETLEGMILILQQRLKSNEGTFRCTASSSVCFWLMMMLCIETSLQPLL